MSRSDHDVPLSAWTDFVTTHGAGSVLDGSVVSVLPFGAFVDVGDGIHGLLPRPEWSATPEPGARVSVRILAIDVENRRFSLALA